jgi:hypothetical protein
MSQYYALKNFCGFWVIEKSCIFAAYSSIIAIMTQLTVSIEDVSMLDQIKQTISLIRGVSSVTLKRRRKTSMDRAMEDIEQGRVYKYDSLDDLIKEIEG